MRYFSALWTMLLVTAVQAQILVEDPTQGQVPPPQPMPQQQPAKVGKGAASDYFKARSSEPQQNVSRETASGGDRYMLMHMGTFLNDKSYRWGRDNRDEDVGQSMFGVTYRVGEWKSSMDLFFRAELMSYKVDDERPLKLSVMPIIAFPDARSDFPLYFGAGAGAGVFFKQVGSESDLSLDYALIVGARFPELFEAGGLFAETGIKGHIHLLSNGQQEGVFLAVGGIFIF